MRERAQSASPESGRSDSSIGMRWVIAATVFAAMAAAYLWLPGFRYFVGRTFSLMATGDFRALKMFILSFGWWAPLVSAGLMIFQTLVAPLPAFILAIANAMAFGVFYGFILTCASALLAAYIAFYLSRWLGRPFIERWLRRLPLEGMIERYGAWGVLLLRLFPVVSFDLISFAAGLTVIRPAPFGLATFLGMIPAVLAFSLLGDSIESANRWSFFGGLILFVVLILFWVGMRRGGIMKR